MGTTVGYMCEATNSTHDELRMMCIKSQLSWLTESFHPNKKYKLTSEKFNINPYG